MSELQSVPFPVVNHSREAPPTWINTNAVLQKILQQLEADVRSKIVLRCDDLPLVFGNEEVFEDLFNSLLQMIFQKKDEVPTLFLHISCAEEEQPLLAEPGLKNYIVQFNTNVKTCADWMRQNKTQLGEITSLLQKNKSTLVLDDAKTPGCIFSVSLPGKSF